MLLSCGREGLTCGSQRPYFSAGSVASVSPLKVGDFLWSAFGSTGAKDHAVVLDAATLEVKLKVPLPKAPTALAAAGRLGFVGTYGGVVVAVQLPAAAPPVLAQPVATQPSAVAAVEAPDPDPSWKLRRVVDGHPKTGRTSGQKTVGTVAAVAWTGDALITGGNDDRLRAFDAHTGKRLWKSTAQPKDIEGLEGCAGGFAARIYGGAIRVISRKGARFKVVGRVAHNGGWMFGLTPDCRFIVADDFDGVLHTYVARGGRHIGDRALNTRLDRRGLRLVGSTLLVPSGDALHTLRVGEKATQPVGGPRSLPPGTGPVVQAFATPLGPLVERCTPTECVVHVGGQALRFDTRGGAWSATVPSSIAVSRRGRDLAWHRDGLELILVYIASDRRQSLGVIPRTMSATPDFAFHPDADLLAVAMQPQPWQVSVYGLRTPAHE